MDGGTINALLLFSGMALIGLAVAVLDWYGRRKDRQSRSAKV
jgi:hypothetical protein